VLPELRDARCTVDGEYSAALSHATVSISAPHVIHFPRSGHWSDDPGCRDYYHYDVLTTDFGNGGVYRTE